MFRKRLIVVLGLALAWGFSPAANAGTMNLNSFVDQSPATVDAPTTRLLMATVNTSASQGGNDADSTTVSIGGTVALADVAEVCAFYNSVLVTCVADPSPLTDISIALGGNQKGGASFDYYVTLNASAAGETISLTVESVTNTNLTDNIPLPQSTATRPITGGSTIPTVTADVAADIAQNTATLGGNVTANGGATVTQRGIVWNTTSPAETGGTVVPMGSGTGTFSNTVSGLPAGTLIYFKAYATNSVGTAYSSPESSFTTAAATLPTVTADAATAIADNSATLGGEVTANGGAPVTARGIVWNTTSPAESGGTVVPMGSGTGTFSNTVGGLPSGTLIYYKAYATNTAGTAYSTPESSFTTTAGAVPPTVTADTATAVTAESATLGGNVTADGGATVSARGIVWNTTSPAETGGTVVPIGTGTGTFSNTVGGLPSGTLIYFKAYATNSAGTSYSSPESSFTTLTASLPTVTADAATAITSDSATLGGNVTADGGATVTERGIVWNTTTPAETGGTPVPMGSGTGAFSNTVSGLPAETQIYFKAYATNSAGTAYSTPDSTFTTEAATAGQVSNLTFATTAGRSARLTWTRGTLDGVIVVMRLTSTTIAHPPDGGDYTGNPEFDAPPPQVTGGPGNYVVYMGTGTSVLVTGLTMSTGYSVAAYEYSGVGAGTTYLATPAEAADTTTDYAVHNYDFRVDCDDCHNHGSFGARGAELKAICSTCHNPSGLANTKLEFGFEETPTTTGHPTPTKNSLIDVVDCGMCHELHNITGTLTGNTTLSTHSETSAVQHNKSFLRANVDKYVSGAATPAYLHTDTPGGATPDRAIEGGTAAVEPAAPGQARGYCQVCHTQTDYHRSTADAPPPTTGLAQCHDGSANDSCAIEVDCGSCHQHTGNFEGAGDCTACHNSAKGIRPEIVSQFARATSHVTPTVGTVTESDCLVCHDQSTHQAQTVRINDPDDDAASFSQPTPAASPIAAGQGSAFETACVNCHDTNGATRLATVSPGPGQTPLSPFTDAPAPLVFDSTTWDASGHGTSAIVTCLGDGTGGGCHGSGHGSENASLLAPAATQVVDDQVTNLCSGCHDADGPSSFNIAAEFNTGTNFQAVAGTGALVNQRHDITVADQAYSSPGNPLGFECNDCHRPHEDASRSIVDPGGGFVVESNPVVNPDTGNALQVYNIDNSYTGDATSFTYYDGTDAYPDLDPTNPDGGTQILEPDYVEFCLVCHDGTTPAGVTMSPNMLNMADSYRLNDQHGRLEGRNSASRGYLKQPWSTLSDYNAGSQPGGGNSTYAALNCTLCHGPHGSGNIFNLRTSITVNGTVMTVGGKEAYMDPALCSKQCDNINNALPEFGSATYTLPVQEDLAWGAWCTFCHEPSHGTSDGTACQAGHLHGGGNF